jgi:hypothetical protein
LSRALTDVKIRGDFHGMLLIQKLSITHLLFVYDIMIFYNGSRRDVDKMVGILELFSHATRMQINLHKYSLSTQNLDVGETNYYSNLFHFVPQEMDSVMKYLDFHLKPNYYSKEDWVMASSKT